MRTNSFQRRCWIALSASIALWAMGAGATADPSELPAHWLKSPAYQQLVPLDALKAVMLPASDLPVPAGVRGQWEKGLPLIQPGEEVVYGDQPFVRRTYIQMNNLETPDGNSQMLNLRSFVATEFGTFYLIDSAETAQYFRDVRKVDVGEDGLLMTQTLPGGLESASVAFRLGEVAFVVTAVIDGELDGVPLALGGAQAWLKKLQSARGAVRKAIDKPVTLVEPSTVPAAPGNTSVSAPEYLADLEEAAGLGVVNAQLRLAEIYQDGADGVEADPVQAAHWARQAAEKGNAQAQCALGSYYDFGMGVEQDQTEAIRWYMLAAAQGDLPAAYNLGLSYLRGEGVEANGLEAFRYFQQAAQGGMAQAEYKLGGLYDAGIGVELDAEIAAQWYRKAADQGLPLAQNDLGVGYLRGEGVAKNGDKAFMWFSKAAEQGLPMAMFNYGACFNTGTGTETDLVQAVLWFSRAAEAGYPNAMFELASAYLKGAGVAKDEERAGFWLARAAAAGHEQAAEVIRQLEEPPPPKPAPVQKPKPAAVKKPVPPTTSKPPQAKKPKPVAHSSATDSWQPIDYPSLSHTFRVPEEWSLDSDLLDEETIQAYSAPTELPGMLIIYSDIGQTVSVTEMKEVLPQMIDDGASEILTPPKAIRVNSTPAVYMSATMDFNGIPSVADVMCVSKGTGLYIIITATFKGDDDGRKTNKRILKSFTF
jgi:TPR repeat protein